MMHNYSSDLSAFYLLGGGEPAREHRGGAGPGPEGGLAAVGVRQQGAMISNRSCGT